MREDTFKKHLLFPPPKQISNPGNKDSSLSLSSIQFVSRLEEFHCSLYNYYSLCAGGDVSDNKADELTKKQNVLKKFEL